MLTQAIRVDIGATHRDEQPFTTLCNVTTMTPLLSNYARLFNAWLRRIEINFPLEHYCLFIKLLFHHIGKILIIYIKMYSKKSIKHFLLFKTNRELYLQLKTCTVQNQIEIDRLLRWYQLMCNQQCNYRWSKCAKKILSFSYISYFDFLVKNCLLFFYLYLKNNYANQFMRIYMHIKSLIYKRNLDL